MLTDARREASFAACRHARIRNAWTSTAAKNNDLYELRGWPFLADPHDVCHKKTVSVLWMRLLRGSNCQAVTFQAEKPNLLTLKSWIPGEIDLGNEAPRCIYPDAASVCSH
jgi:hypothetical protein